MTIARYAGGIALVAALLAVPAVAQNYAVLSADLFGGAVPDGGAGDDAVADFDGEIDLAQDQLCYFMELEELGDATAAHIHRGEEGKNGPEVMTLPLPESDADEVCVKAEKSLLQSMADQPRDYYIDIHSTSKPRGAVRGQFGS